MSSAALDRCRRNARRMLIFFLETLAFIIYFMIGWYLFTYMEDGIHLWNCGDSPGVKGKDFDNLVDKIASDDNIVGAQMNVTEEVVKVLEKHFREYFHEAETDPSVCSKWLHFVTYSLATVGHGSIDLRTDEARVIYIVYALFGIPLFIHLLYSAAMLIVDINSAIIRGIDRCCCKEREPRCEHLKLLIVNIFLFLLMYFTKVMIWFYQNEDSSIAYAFYSHFVSYYTFTFETNTLAAHSWSYYVPVDLYIAQSLLVSVAIAAFKLSSVCSSPCSTQKKKEYIEEEEREEDMVRSTSRSSHTRNNNRGMVTKDGSVVSLVSTNL